MNYILLIIGESGSGKSTIVRELCKRNGYKELISYTDRPKRTQDEDCHIFLTKEEADKLYMSDKIVAYTVFDGHQYFCTENQVEESDIYVIDPDGMEKFLKEYKGNKNVYSIYIYATEEERLARMLDRGQSVEDAYRRIEHDRKAFDRDMYVSGVVHNKKLNKAVKKVERLIKLFDFEEKVNDWIAKRAGQCGN